MLTLGFIIGRWEDIQVSQPEGLDDYGDEDNDIEDQSLARKEKGKSKAWSFEMQWNCLVYLYVSSTVFIRNLWTEPRHSIISNRVLTFNITSPPTT